MLTAALAHEVIAAPLILGAAENVIAITFEVLLRGLHGLAPLSRPFSISHYVCGFAISIDVSVSNLACFFLSHSVLYKVISGTDQVTQSLTRYELVANFSSEPVAIQVIG